jgi:hypothetical protein
LDTCRSLCIATPGCRGWGFDLSGNWKVKDGRRW